MENGGHLTSQYKIVGQNNNVPVIFTIVRALLSLVELNIENVSWR